MAQILTSFESYKGGTNNRHIAIVVNSRLQPIKTFKSLKSIDHAKKRANTYLNKFEARAEILRQTISNRYSF